MPCAGFAKGERIGSVNRGKGRRAAASPPTRSGRNQESLVYCCATGRGADITAQCPKLGHFCIFVH